MSEKMWQKVAKILVRTSGNPLFQANDTMIELLKTLLNEEQAAFLLNFRNPILTFAQLKEKTGLEDADLSEMLNSLLDEGFIIDLPHEVSGIMEYHLLAPIPDTFEYSLVKEGTIEKRKKLAKLYDKMFEEASVKPPKTHDELFCLFPAQQLFYPKTSSLLFALPPLQVLSPLLVRVFLCPQQILSQLQ